jgi:hypothetical protein
MERQFRGNNRHQARGWTLLQLLFDLNEGVEGTAHDHFMSAA